MPTTEVAPIRFNRESLRDVPRLNSLTSLRLFAAIAVVLTHVGYSFTSPRLLRVSERYLYVGVEFFFIISGFVLTWTYKRESEQTRWSRSLWLRLTKIYPLDLLTMAFALMFLPNLERIPNTFGTFADMTLIQAWFPDITVFFGGNGVAWSLSCELFFYALFPIVILRTGRLGRTASFVVISVIVSTMTITPLAALAIGLPKPYFYWMFFIFPPYEFGFFLLGMIMAEIISKQYITLPRSLNRISAVSIALVIATWTWYSFSTNQYLPAPFADLILLPPFVLLISSSAQNDLRGTASWIKNPVFLTLSSWSFALYLLHKPIYLLTSQWSWWSNNGGIYGGLLLLVYLSLTFAISGLVHHLIELRLQNFLRKLTLDKILHGFKVVIKITVCSSATCWASLSLHPKWLYREAVSLCLNGRIRYRRATEVNPKRHSTQIKAKR